jgi:hypothetical protein
MGNLNKENKFCFWVSGLSIRFCFFRIYGRKAKQDNFKKNGHKEPFCMAIIAIFQDEKIEMEDLRDEKVVLNAAL